ncbi:uncharacterized protein LOC113469508 [Diaphorina citri]|uniref:Uncharacterized protein LOC113469508 n=1 Tax=Diaphorina citri TaxID=121845 RepID=A0A3Q0J3M0_DIACI|nr:uncharacterized protein LOC113469508 [Diaphorina citri]
MERNRFFNSRQQGQTLLDFITQLKNIAASCEFRERDSIIKDIFICNMSNQYNYGKEKLLEDPELTLDKAEEVASRLVASRQHVSALQIRDSVSSHLSNHQISNLGRSHSQGRSHSHSSKANYNHRLSSNKPSSN